MWFFVSSLFYCLSNNRRLLKFWWRKTIKDNRIRKTILKLKRKKLPNVVLNFLIFCKADEREVPKLTIRTTFERRSWGNEFASMYNEEKSEKKITWILGRGRTSLRIFKCFNKNNKIIGVTRIILLEYYRTLLINLLPIVPYYTSYEYYLIYNYYIL